MSSSNLSTSFVATAPSPPTSGGTLVLQTGEGDAKGFPSSGRFRVVVHPAGTQPTRANGELAVCTRTAASDTINLVLRAQGGTTARSIGIGDQVSVVQAVEDFAPFGSFEKDAGGTTATLTVPGAMLVTTTTLQVIADRDYYFPITVDDWTEFDRVFAEISTASGTPGSVARLALYAASKRNQPQASLIEEFPTIATDTLGVVSSTPSGGARIIPRGRYVLAVNASHTATLRALAGSPAGGPMIQDIIGTSTQTPYVSNVFVARTHAAFQSTPTIWNTITVGAVGFRYPLFLRISGNG